MTLITIWVIDLVAFEIVVSASISDWLACSQPHLIGWNCAQECHFNNISMNCPKIRKPWSQNILKKDQIDFTAYFTMTHKWWFITFNLIFLSKMIYFSETCGADVVVGIDMQNFNEGTWSLRIASPQITPQ